MGGIMRKLKHVVLLFLFILMAKSTYAINSWALFYRIHHLSQQTYQYEFVLRNEGPAPDAIRRWSISYSLIPEQWSNYSFLLPPGWRKRIYASGSISFYVPASHRGKRIYGKDVPGAEVVGSATFYWQFDLNGGPFPDEVSFLPERIYVSFQPVDIFGNDYGKGYRSKLGRVALIPEPSPVLLFGSALFVMTTFIILSKRFS
jgi:hypothetical protein